ncbi:uncharacterized protein SCO1/SenC/PrrC, involved in biogenesis of respiratory and photosynthetic systems [Halovivax ruber XH-70]|uniref:Uncharacterized protein SCO1/SenC/PrrC, involved in biogenesis of respiratory and photosynthetic systems n=1 Tax=Halovivax ruber (strain DSM 18193 / JCM 13892 / XH-70) TaxID=797302 RepID=U3GM76_HALRX|nr:TlpA disulfide reductase family protein [Halovivax ruber]AGB17469.1 uncharacterized protein SCO1/SenC/PrrC, involved in biogenesis of respiratory and photosynthetic systems [Halovivax ruber XH-70]
MIVRRRELIAGGAALATLGGAGALAVTDWQPGSDDGGVEPVELAAISGQGEEGDTVTVPERGRVSLVELFATSCDVCSRQMAPLGRVAERVGDDVQVVSVTNEPLGGTVTRADVADWWTAHEGTWPVAHDADLDLTSALNAVSVPYTVVLDAENRVDWRHSGYADHATLLARLEEARA